MIKENLNSIMSELPSGTSLVAVSKYHPVEAIIEAYEAGQRVFGENRPQELQKKAEDLKSRGLCPDIVWHFQGHLQTNKLKMVLPYVSLVHSVDSVHLLKEIDKWGRNAGKVIDVLLELHIGAEETKQGFAEEEVLDLLFTVSQDPHADGTSAAYPNVRICGLMGMASHTDDLDTVDADFERIDSFMAYVVDLFPELTSLRQLSIGMSGDWKIAVKHGSTLVRIGTAIFGERQY